VISATFRIQTMAGVPVYNWQSQDGNTCAVSPSVRIWLQGPTAVDSVGQWFSLTAYAIPLGLDGAWTVTVPLLPENFVDTHGHLGTDPTVYPSDPESAVAAWQQLLDGVSDVGLAFGGGCFYGHGVQVNGGGAAFVLSRFEIQ
jgi:hypothetical protein